ncbi:MAG: hypothetical protein ACKVOB_02660 [Sphingomonas sp.]
MKVTIGAALGGAWRLARRDVEILVPVTGLFLFLPTLAMLLLMPSPPMGPGAGASEQQLAVFVQAYSDWLVGNAPAFGAAAACSLMGSATLAAFYLDPQAQDVRGALARAVALLPRFMLAAVIVGVPTFIGAWLFIVPGLYVMARTMLAGPILVASRPVSALGAVMASVRMTRGNGLVLTALAAVLLLAGQLLPIPFLAMVQSLGAAHAANPVVVALLSMAAATCAAAAALATILVRVWLYGELAARG